MLFENIKSKLKTEIKPNYYNKFIKNLEFDTENSSSDTLLVKAPNIYIAKFVKRNFSEKIAQIYKKETDIETSVEIIVKKSIPKKIVIEETKTTNLDLVLNPEFTFESFVVGESNQFAYNAAKSTAEMPGKSYNPLFIYGKVGLGKSHLLQAIGNHLKDKLNVIYITSEQFMNEFTESIRNHSMDKFHEKYRNCDLLLVDDVQFFSGKDRTQDEFFHTFNELYNQKKQICITSDRPPQQITDLVDRLRSRFESGLIVDIQPPELETKIQIIKKKCEINGFNLSNEVIEFIATTLYNNIREIEGMLTKLNALAKVVGVDEITIDFAKQALKETLEDRKDDEITLEKIIELIAKEFNIKPSEITSKSRNRNIVAARRTAIYLAREATQESTPTIAKYFGLRDHSAVSHSIKSFNKKLKEDNSFRIKIEELKSKIHIKICE